MYIGLLILAACMACGAYLDIRYRRLPNWLSGVTLVAGLGYAAITGWDSVLAWHAASFALALAAGMGIFALGMWGGGDGKFFAASAAWFPLALLPMQALAISMVGLALVIWWFVRRGASLRKGKGPPMVPYGVAIALGTLAVFALPLTQPSYSQSILSGDMSSR